MCVDFCPDLRRVKNWDLVPVSDRAFLKNEGLVNFGHFLLGSRCVDSGGHEAQWFLTPPYLNRFPGWGRWQAQIPGAM